MGQGLMLDDDHVYKLNGQVVPSVTQIVGEFSPFPFKVEDWYLERGTALHRAIQLDMQGKLDRDTIDPSYEGKFNAYLKFQTEVGIEPEFIEKMLASKRYGFAGTLDCIGYINGVRWLIDWKGSVQSSVLLQLGGYFCLWEELSLTPIASAAAVELKDNGNYSMNTFDARELRQAHRAFLAALSLSNWKKSRGIK